jgi:hypothetical protein
VQFVLFFYFFPSQENISTKSTWGIINMVSLHDICLTNKIAANCRLIIKLMLFLDFYGVQNLPIVPIVRFNCTSTFNCVFCWTCVMMCNDMFQIWQLLKILICLDLLWQNYWNWLHFFSSSSMKSTIEKC